MTAEQLTAALMEFASQQGQAQPVQLMPAPYGMVVMAATLAGYSEKAPPTRPRKRRQWFEQLLALCAKLKAVRTINKRSPRMVKR